MSQQTKITRKLTTQEANTIVATANEKYLSKESQLPERIEAWCTTNFNPEREHQALVAFEGILKAATTGEGNTFNLKTAEIIIKRHQEIRGLNH